MARIIKLSDVPTTDRNGKRLTDQERVDLQQTMQRAADTEEQTYETHLGPEGYTGVNRRR